MTNEYDGPSIYRHGHDIDDKKRAPLDRDPATTPIRRPFKSTYVPPFRQRIVEPRKDYQRIIQLLQKKPADYYRVVEDLPDDSPTKKQEQVVQKRPVDDTSIKKRVPKRQITMPVRNDHQALGHTLSDILKSESQAQRQLKIFNEQRQKNHK